jgi:hypothetical protein
LTKKVVDLWTNLNRRSFQKCFVVKSLKFIKKLKCVEFGRNKKYLEVKTRQSLSFSFSLVLKILIFSFSKKENQFLSANMPDVAVNRATRRDLDQVSVQLKSLNL